MQVNGHVLELQDRDLKTLGIISGTYFFFTKADKRDCWVGEDPRWGYTVIWAVKAPKGMVFSRFDHK